MHCCAAALDNRKQNNPNAKFGPNDTKLLYTLHWILLDAASECEDLDNEKNPNKNGALHSYLHSLDTVQLFVYLFAPLIGSMEDGDFQTLKLENGMRLWQPLWDFTQPDIPCFSTPVKPKRHILKAQRSLMKVNTNAANIYIGKGSSADNIYLGFDEPSSHCSVNESSSPLAPLARMSDICGTASLSDNQSVSVEIVCEVCKTVMQAKLGEGLTCKCGKRDSFISVPDTRLASLQKLPSIDRDYVSRRLESAITSGQRLPSEVAPDILSASYFDVAVLRCLFTPNWSEDGVYWALRYMHQRLLEVCDELRRVENTRERSKSLPVPDIEISQYQPPSPPTKLDADISADIARSKSESTNRREPPYKRMRIPELKLFLEGRKSSGKQHDSGTDGEEIESQSPKSIGEDPVFEDEDEDMTRPESALAHVGMHKDRLASEDQEPLHSGDVVRRQSMPSLTRGCTSENEKEEDSGTGEKKRDSVTRTTSCKPDILTKPIITITQESPDPSPTCSEWSRGQRGSVVSERSERSENIKNQPSLTRSHTDSNISYTTTEDVQEVSGSVHYIQKNGHLNYLVILKASLHVANMETSARVCRVLLNILNCLFDLDIIEKKEVKVERKEGAKDKLPEEKPKDVKKKEMTAHNIAMETIVR